MPFTDIEDALNLKVFEAFSEKLRIIPAYQPIVDLESGKISSFEVLARIESSELGHVSPAIFIPIVERLGFLDSMTDRLLALSCSELRDLDGEFRFAVNVSPQQFASDNLVPRIKDIAERTGFPLRRIQIEITENAILDDTAVVHRNADLLREEGIRIILDDFGVGYSSFSRLQAIKFDKIKIDSSFVGTMEVKRDSRKIVSAVIGLGHSLGLSVVAEGIETEYQLKMLQQLGCNYGQGYLFSKPIFADKLPALLAERGQAAHDPRPLEMSCNRRLAELDSVYNSNKIAICFIDRDFRVVTINRSFRTEIGAEEDEIRGKHINDVFPGNVHLVRAAMDLITEYNDIRGKSVILNTKCGLASVEMRAVRDENLEVIGFNLLSVDRVEEEKSDKMKSLLYFTAR